jgi:hypothetical protein
MIPLTPNLLKASLCHAALRKAEPFLLAEWLQSSLHESAEKIGEHHIVHVTPLPTPWEYNPAAAPEHHPHATKLKTINSQ